MMPEPELIEQLSHLKVYRDFEEAFCQGNRVVRPVKTTRHMELSLCCSAPRRAVLQHYDSADMAWREHYRSAPN